MSDNKERDVNVDVVKALGIFCMVAGHCGFPFTHFVYLFHMAIFFIASGYCYKDNNSNGVKTSVSFIKRKIVTLWLPYVLWTAIYSMLHNFFIKINVSGYPFESAIGVATRAMARRSNKLAPNLRRQKR